MKRHLHFFEPGQPFLQIRHNLQTCRVRPPCIGGDCMMFYLLAKREAHYYHCQQYPSNHHCFRILAASVFSTRLCRGSLLDRHALVSIMIVYVSLLLVH